MSKPNNWQTVIGLEIHAQLATESKIFSPAPIALCDSPNTQAREVDSGMPGALPTLNRAAVSCAIRLGLAVGAQINRRSEFARKNYFYPDLPKGYQISQYEYPVVSGGEMLISAGEGGGQKRVGITRAHLEEDAGKLVHDAIAGASAVDLNRAGVALLEIVSEPDMTSPQEAVLYAVAMHKLARWLGVCDGNMQEGNFRIDANISVNLPGEAMGTRCEIKNLNSFRFLEMALQYERERQIEVLEAGGKIEQETRLFDTASGKTRAMRGKEDAHDYRYFPDPDLPPLIVSEEWIEQERAALPELPQARKRRLVEGYALSDYDAEVIVSDREFSDYYDAALAALAGDGKPNAQTAKLCANWLCGDFSALLNESKATAAAAPVTAKSFAALLAAVQSGDISGKTGKEVLAKMWQSGESAEEIISRDGLRQISDDKALEETARAIVAAHPQQAAEYRAGKERLLGFFVGQMMKQTQGRANPEQANAAIKRLLAQGE